MTTISTTAPDWLALRAGADAAARSQVLAAALARAIPAGPVVVHDLGAGTGAMPRWLAPRLPGPQRWVLHDGDAGILSHLDLHGVADRDGWPVAAAVRVGELAALPEDAFRGATAVTASALLDVVTREEAARIVAACVRAGAPALFSLTVTGSVRISGPARSDVRALGAAFDDHQRRTVDGRTMLGPDAVSVVAAGFTAAGWRVRTAATPWRLSTGGLLTAWLDGWIGAALEQRPELADVADRHRARWEALAAAGRLRAVVQHEDLLACPA